MKNSIKLRLMTAFLLVAALVGTVAGGVAFYDTYRETYKLQDDLLKQISAYIDPQNIHLQRVNSDNDARISVFVFDRLNPQSKIQLPADSKDNFYTLKKDDGKFKPVNEKKQRRLFYTLKNAGELYRAYVRSTPAGTIVVMQENEYREELASRSAWASVIPLLVMLSLITLLTVFIVGRAMQPITRLSKKVAQRREQDLTPLSTAGIPAEVTGFVVAINELLSRTQRFIQQQQRFIADAAHELRSPMTALSLQAERLSAQTLPAPAREQLAQLKQGIRRNRALLEQLLSLARVQNALPVPWERISLQTIFARVIEDLLPLAEQNAQDVGVVSQGDAVFYGRATDIYLLIKTLVNNAIRYTPAGSRIDLSAVETPSELLIQVEDNGPGIARQERERVFDPFYRILGSEQQGSGLGLAIAAGIVKHYQGEIRLRDSVHFEHGLLVIVRLKNRQQHNL